MKYTYSGISFACCAYIVYTQNETKKAILIFVKGKLKPNKTNQLSIHRITWLLETKILKFLRNIYKIIENFNKKAYL